MSQISPLPLGLYRHFKGNYYKLKAIATMQSGPSEGEQVAVYASTCDKATHCRSVANFTEKVQVERDGETVFVPRFEYQESLTALVEGFDKYCAERRRKS